MTDAPKKRENKSLVTLDIESLLPPTSEVTHIDLKDFLFKGMIVKEAEFRARVDTLPVEAYHNKYVVTGCSTDAIIPMWAYMLLVAKLSGVARAVVYGHAGQTDELLLMEVLKTHNWGLYDEQRVVLKGCGGKKFSPQVYEFVTAQLVPRVRSLMFGEPCSTVPVFKKTGGE